jgi:transposase
MYVKHFKLTRYQQLKLMEHFIAGTPARTATDLVGIHRNSAIRFFHKLRCAIALKQHDRAAQFYGEIEVDESFFLVVQEKENEAGVLPERSLSSGCSNVAKNRSPYRF